MPITRCLLARRDDVIERALVEEPALVVPVERDGDLLAIPFDETYPSAWTRAFERFGWLQAESMTMELIDRVWAIAQRCERPLAWFYSSWNGTAIYNDAALVFDPSRGRTLYVRTTEDSARYEIDGDVEHAWTGVPYEIVMETFGLSAPRPYYEFASSGRECVVLVDDQAYGYIATSERIDVLGRFSFPIPRERYRLPWWWMGTPVVIPSTIANAIRIADRTGRDALTNDELSEALIGPPKTIVEELSRARATLAIPGHYVAFVECWLSIGNSTEDELIDDWIASHADEIVAAREEIQKIVDLPHDPRAKRSAIEFMLQRCRRLNVELEIDLTRLDADLETQRFELPERPWGIPSSHTWWT